MIEFWSRVLIIAVLFDIILGEPPAFIHPVVWMGKLINLFVKFAPQRHRKIYGFLMVISCIGITVLVVKSLELTGKGYLGLVISAFFLKSSFSIRMLLVSALGIQRDLDKGRIDKVRNDLKTFVGRDTSRLDEHRSASAVIESLAESFVDGILSPLLYFVLFGLPGALAFRMINTLDSMVGYKKEPFRDLGYAAARLDDLANYVPARLSPAIIALTSIFLGRPRDALRACWHDHNKTASPNSGWPMAAVSGALNVRLEKVEYHIIGDKYHLPVTFHVRKAVYLVGLSSFIVIWLILSMKIIPLVAF